MHPVQLFELVFIMLLAILVLHWIALRLNRRRQWRCWSAERAGLRSWTAGHRARSGVRAGPVSATTANGWRLFHGTCRVPQAPCGSAFPRDRRRRVHDADHRRRNALAVAEPAVGGLLRARNTKGNVASQRRGKQKARWRRRLAFSKKTQGVNYGSKTYSRRSSHRHTLSHRARRGESHRLPQAGVRRGNNATSRSSGRTERSCMRRSRSATPAS